MKNFFVLSLFLLVYAGTVSADQLKKTVSPEIYTLHLQYENGNISEDPNFDFPFYQSFGEYKEEVSFAGAYFGKIFSVKNQELAIFYFSLPALLVGESKKLSLEAPYFPNAKILKLYDSAGKEIFSLDLAPLAILCNENGKCDQNYGENYQNCSSDCSEPETEKYQELHNKSSNNVFQWVYYIGGAIFLLGLSGLVWLLKFREKE